EPVEKRRAPANPAAAANSVQFVIGKALVHGTVAPHDFTAEGLRDAEALAVAARTACRLEGDAPGIAVEVELANGERLRGQIETALPMSAETLVRKFEDCCRYSARPLESAAVARLTDIILDVDRLEDVGLIAAIASGAVQDRLRAG